MQNRKRCDRNEPSKKRFGSPIKLRFTNSTETATADERNERDASCPKRDDSPAKERSSSRLKSKSSYAESEQEEFLGEEVSLEDTSVQEASVQASLVQKLYHN